MAGAEGPELAEGDTPGGRYYAEFDDQAPVTREGQLIFFAQFLHSGGRWERLLRDCVAPVLSVPWIAAPAAMQAALRDP